MDWISALQESVSFERFLSEPVQWYTMAHVSLAPTAIGHGSCSSTGQFVCRLQQDLPPPTAMLRALAVLDQSELYAMIAHGMQQIWEEPSSYGVHLRPPMDVYMAQTQRLAALKFS
ncbi:uncharacterized protein LOC119293179 [Triticum dicoccoides]|uniref:uncharacterized protein LOC119293179 n=1 Tax=Triticum dicoccoides TaxID=85692 RepID=UPI00188E75D4|nr:uncharacterized protein LOC119293179 [Triticum dicoccoides]